MARAEQSPRPSQLPQQGPDEGSWKGATRRLEQRIVVAFLLLSGTIVFVYGWGLPELSAANLQEAFVGLAGSLGLVVALGAGFVRPGLWEVREAMKEREDAESTLVDRLKQRARRLDEYSQRLEQRNRGLRRFAYVLAHDLREPARTVSTHARLVQRRVGDDLPEGPEGDLETAVEGAKRLDRLLADLLTYTELEQRGKQVQELDLGSVVDDAVARVAGEVDVESLRIEVGELPTVQADHGLLVQLFRQLIHNAVKFGPEDEAPVVEIGAEEAEDGWRIEVADNGIGMAPDHANRVFSLFERLHDWDEYEGTGVGLALCRRIVERHGGEIGVESEPGAGCSFHFTLPEAPERRTEGQEPAREGARHRELV